MIMSNYNMYRLLNEMKEQQAINEKALDFLRTRSIYSNGYFFFLFVYLFTKTKKI